VCTDLATGHEIWLSRGSLVDAIRASFAMPGVFPPVPMGARQLADGALVNPVPVSVCHALGAHMVVAVNLNADIVGRSRTPSGNFEVAAGFDLFEMLSGGGLGGGIGGEPGWATAARRAFRRGEPDKPSVFGVMVSALGIILDRVTRSRLAGEPPDVHIVPRLGHIGLAEFHRAAEMIDLGYGATRAALPDILEACRLFGIPGVDGRGAPDS
jgi:NTE family protein